MSTRRYGKIIDRWTLPVGLIHDRGTPTVEVPVRLDSSSNTFWIVFEYAERSYKEKGKNLDTLKQAVADWLQAIEPFDWKDFLYVEFKRSATPDDDVELLNDEEREFSLTLVLRHIQIANHGTAKAVWRDLSRVNRSGQPIDGEPDTGLDVGIRGHWGADSPEVKAAVPDTPENRAALRAIMDGFHALATRLQDLMLPEQIMNTLQNVKTLPLLPAPEPPAPKRKAKGA